MRRILFILIICVTTASVSGQKVDSIRIEQAGDLIKIRYKILDSKENQVFKVTVLCSINGGLESVLKSLSGDYGDNVVGGRDEYMVLWDVLKDVDEVQSVDFSVKAELKSGNPTSNKGKKTRESGIHVLFSLDSKAAIFGPTFGYIKNWGVVGGLLFGTLNTVTEQSGNVGGEYLPEGSEVGVAFSSYNIGVTKRVVNNEKFKMHLLGKMAFGKREGDRYTNVFSNYSKLFPGVGLGVFMDIGRLSIALDAMEYPGLMESKFPDFLVFGIGLNF